MNIQGDGCFGRMYLKLSDTRQERFVCATAIVLIMTVAALLIVVAQLLQAKMDYTVGALVGGISIAACPALILLILTSCVLLPKKQGTFGLTKDMQGNPVVVESRE